MPTRLYITEVSKNEFRPEVGEKILILMFGWIIQWWQNIFKYYTN